VSSSPWLQIKSLGERTGLSFESSETRITNKISIIDLKKGDLIHRFEGGRFEPLIVKPHLRSRDRWSRSIAG
jgi:hypothetical protein